MRTAVAPGAPAGLTSWRERSSAPVDSSSLALVRAGLGFLVAWEVWREIDHGLLRADYLEPRFLFSWAAFDWVDPLPGDTWTLAVFGVLAISGLFVAAGAFYRPAAVVMTVGLTYWFLLEKARYLNHRYLACLLAFLLVVVPAHAAFSVDARRKPWVRSATVPTWSVALLRFQVGAPYVFAGIAKLNFDWLVRAEPLSMWLAHETDFPVIGRFFTEPGFVRALAWSSTLLDLTVPFLLLHRRTRAPAYGLALTFHLMNSRLFDIGMFPWMMILATTIFFDADWPRRMASAARRGAPRLRAALAGGFMLGFALGGLLPRSFSGVRAVIGGIGVAVLAFQLHHDFVRRGDGGRVEAPGRSRAVSGALAVFLAGWVAVQLLLPLRHFVIPGNAQWTEEGTRFAWHMLLHAKAGTVTFQIAGLAEPLPVEFIVTDHLTTFQIRKMVQHPDMLVEFAHYIEDFYKGLGVSDDLQIYAETSVSLNGRPRQRLLDPTADLTAVRRPYLPPADWIEPLEAFG